jgi:hypothetical protein
MADKENNIVTRVKVDADQAQREIVKLNGTASDSTQNLEARVAAKNKQVEIQNKLSKQTISELEEEVKLLEGLGAKEKDIEKAKKKLNSARLKATRQTVNNEKAQRKLNEAYKNSKNPIKNLDAATGGLLGKMQAFVANPIGAVITALVALFQLFKNALNRSEDGAASFNAIMASINQVFGNIMEALGDVLEPLFADLAKLLAEKVGPAMKAMGVYTDTAKTAIAALIDAVNLGLTPLKLLWTTAKATAKVFKGDFKGAKQEFVDLKDETVDLGKSLAENVVETVDNAKKATEEYGEAYKKASEESDSLISRAAQIELLQNQLNKDKRAQLLLDAKLEVKAKEAKRDSKDLSLSWEDRFTALKKFSSLEIEREKRASAMIERELKLLEMRRSLGRNTKDDEEEYNRLLIEREKGLSRLADAQLNYNRRSKEFINQQKKEEAAAQKAQLELYELRKKAAVKSGEELLDIQKDILKRQYDLDIQNEELTQEQKDLLKKQYDLKKQELDKENKNKEFEAQLELDELDIQRREAKGERTLELELELLEKKKQQELSNTELIESERQVIIEKYAIQAAEIKRAEDEAKKQSEENYRKNALASVAEIFGVSKELALSQMIMAAPQAIGQSFKKAAETYAFPLSVVMGAAGAMQTAAPIYKAIKDIKSASSATSTTTTASTAATTTASITDLAANNAARLVQDPSLTDSSTQTAAASVSASAKSNVVFSEDAYSNFQQQVQFKEDKTTY